MMKQAFFFSCSALYLKEVIKSKVLKINFGGLKDLKNWKLFEVFFYFHRIKKVLENFLEFSLLFSRFFIIKFHKLGNIVLFRILFYGEKEISYGF